MSQDTETLKEDRRYVSPRNAVAVSEHINPTRIIRPIVIIATVIAVMCIYTYAETQDIITNAEHATNQAAEYVANNIANEMDYANSSIKFAADTISRSMTSDTLANPAEVIKPMVANTPFDQIEYIRADGMNVMNIGEPFDASDRVYYIEGIKGNTGIWNNFHPKTSKETLMNFYTPIMYQGKTSGVLTGYIAATTQLAPLFETELYGHDIYGLLIDENDMVICSTIKSDFIPDLSLDDFMDSYGITDHQKAEVHAALSKATAEAASYKDSSDEGRVCVATIPGTEWKVVVLVPHSSFSAIISENTQDSLITVAIISLILIAYAAYVLLKEIKRRRDIAEENAMLEEENRLFDEQNKRAFKEISEIRDIIASAEMGTWRIELVEGKAPRMYVDDTMKALLGITGKEQTPEQTYNDWFDNISPQAVSSVLESVNEMQQGRFSEVTYLWSHPYKGERYVRCGGTAQAIEGGYLLSGYHYDVDEVVREDLAKVKMLQDALNEKNDYYHTLGTLAGIYNSLHVIDLVKDTVIEFRSKNKDSDTVDQQQNATEVVARRMAALATDDCREQALEFTDLATLANRMQNNRHISTQLIGKRIGWFLASFITMEADADGRPTRVVFTTQSIDEAKRQEERLIHRSRTDELTGLLNRRAYEEDIYEQNDIPAKDCFVSMSLDVNGLKAVNDTLGHAAGDELLIGASRCIKKCLGDYGKVYRTGGDEFIAILFCDKETLAEALANFEKTMASWSGKMVDRLSISYGFVSSQEQPKMSVRELGIIADKRMYEAKAAYYKATGLSRREPYL
ncbi:MAG: diguanylate cyclase [Coriobacteriales bacterium]|nr:diguanylate cyclase [Coriobacteriales bacterium]